MLRIRLRAQVRPTEDAAKVRAAMLKLFPAAELRDAPGEVVGETPDLERLRELIRSARVPDTARGVMLAGLRDDGLRARFMVGKQAAAAGRAAFGTVRGPLGDIEVVLEGTEPFEVERAIYRVAHDTTVEPELAEVPPGERPVVE